MRFSDLVRGASLRGTASQLTPASSLRLGRAIGTFWLRHGSTSRTVVVGRARGPAEQPVRDGLVAGLVASGLVVADLGVVESDRFTGALRRGPRAPLRGAVLWPVVGGVFIAATADSLGVMLFQGPRPVVGPRLGEIARVADDGVFATAPGGRVVCVDARALPGQPGNDRDDGDSGSDDSVDGGRDADGEAA